MPERGKSIVTRALHNPHEASHNARADRHGEKINKLREPKGVTNQLTVHFAPWEWRLEERRRSMELKDLLNWYNGMRIASVLQCKQGSSNGYSNVVSI